MCRRNIPDAMAAERNRLSKTIVTKPEPTQQPETTDNLSKTDEEAVEENINGFDISDDEAITRQAESHDDTNQYRCRPERNCSAGEAKSESQTILWCCMKTAAGRYHLCCSTQKYKLPMIIS